MKMKPSRLNCPKCGMPYPIGRIFRQLRRVMKCPFCGTRLAFNKWSSLYIGTLAIFTLYVIVFLVGSRRIIAWPNIALFLFFAFVYGRILSLLLGSLEIAPEKISLNPFHNQTKEWRILTIGSVVAIVLVGLSIFLLRRLPPLGILTLVGLFLLAFCILIISLGRGLLGIGGIPKKEEKLEPPKPLCSEPVINDRRDHIL
jgi:uncharacterized protein (DUF983 family)